ncbi:hypothetical protein BKA56DRAFT_620892 [Ilyonectria sp. MPI-CAGE-AT-0026]|nr:hypothetical protein BKA56DRAFT_620892 [Ilyonectria sp. MPI-CAGE-AT-0026]
MASFKSLTRLIHAAAMSPAQLSWPLNNMRFASTASSKVVRIAGREVSIPTGILINNEFRKSIGGNVIAPENLAIGKDIIQIEEGREEDVEAAFPAIFGHEGAGIVRAIGNKVKNVDLKVGDAVTISLIRAVNASLALQVIRPSATLTHKSITMRFDSVIEAHLRGLNWPLHAMHLYAPLGCGFQTGARTVLNSLKPKEYDSLVIFGLDSVGFTALITAKYLKVGRIITMYVVQSRLDLAKELGATDTINSIDETDVVKAIKNLADGGSSFAIDCTGIPKVIESVIASVGPLGTAVLVRVPPASAEIKLNALEFLLGNKTFVGVIEGDSNPTELIPQLITMHQAGNFPIDRPCKSYPFSGRAVSKMACRIVTYLLF